MNLKNLVKKLSDLETALQTFSYENLTAAEAQELKDALTAFRAKIESKIPEEAAKTVGDPTRIELKNNEGINTSSPQTASKTIYNPPGSSRFEEYLKDSPLSRQQLAAINAILAASDIPTRISNDLPEASKMEPEKAISERNPNNSTKSKSKSMSTSNKSTTGAVKHSKMDGKSLVQIDLNPVLEDCLGKTDLLQELIKLYKQNALEFIGQLKIHIQNLDFESIRFAAHKIKSGLRMMNTQELLVIAEQIEAASKVDKDIKHLEFLFACFVKEYPIVERAIDEEFQKLGQNS